MKTVELIAGGSVSRVKDAEADSRVKSGLWRYCPKSMWKEPTKADVEAKKAAEAEKAKVARAEAEERKARKKQAEKEIIEKVKKTK